MKKLVGHQIAESGKVRELIQNLIQEVTQLNSSVSSVCDPQEEHKISGQGLVDSIGQTRGRPLFYPYVGTGAGQGVYVELEDGSIKMDLVNGIGVHILGHGHPRIMEACLNAGLSDIVNQGNIQPNREYERFNRRLVEFASAKSRLKYSWITTSGSMSNENALKMARQKSSPAKMVIAMKDAFAGRTTMMAEVTDNPAYRQGLPNYDEVLRVPYFDVKNAAKSSEEALKALKENIEKHRGKIAAFMFEPLLGEGGYKVATREFFIPLFEECKKEGIAIWADEVQTFLRTGEIFCFEKLDIGNYLDLCTVAKTAQIGATLYTEEYNPKPGLIAGTFSGSTAALAAGNAIFDEMTENNYFGADGRIAKIHNEFVSMLKELEDTTCKGLLQDAGGMGLMVAVTPLDGSKEKTMALLKVLFKNGLLAFACGHGPYRLRFLLPAVMTSEDIQSARGILEKSIKELS